MHGGSTAERMPTARLLALGLGLLLLAALGGLLAGCASGSQDGGRKGAGRPTDPGVAPATAPRPSQAPQPQGEVLNPRVEPPPAGVFTPPVAPVFDIPMREGFITAGKAVERAVQEVRPMTARGGRLTLRSVRLTTFKTVSHGGEYLPAQKPVWAVTFGGDGRLWERSRGGGMVTDPSEEASGLVMVGSAEVGIDAESGKVLFGGTQGGRAALQREGLEHYRGRLLAVRGEEFVLALPPVVDGGTRQLTVVLPMGAELTRQPGRTGGAARVATFADLIFSPPGTPLDVWGLSVLKDVVVASRLSLGTPPAVVNSYNGPELPWEIVGTEGKGAAATKVVFLPDYPEREDRRTAYLQRVGVQLMQRFTKERDVRASLWDDRSLAERAVGQGQGALFAIDLYHRVGDFEKRDNEARMFLASSLNFAELPLAEPVAVEVPSAAPRVYIRIKGRTYGMRDLPAHREGREACGLLQPTILALWAGDSNGFGVGTRVYLRSGFSVDHEIWVFNAAGQCARFVPDEP